MKNYWSKTISVYLKFGSFLGVFFSILTPKVSPADSSLYYSTDTYKNQDGSVSFYNPNIFENYNRYSFSVSSDPHQLCKKLGNFDLSIESKAFSYVQTAKEINANGDLLHGTVNCLAYEHITCRHSKDVAPVSAKYKKFLRNPDGTFTVVEPRFGFLGRTRKISAEYSNLDGVCRHFGSHYYVPGSMNNDFKTSKTRLIQINEQGFTTGFSPNVRGNLRIKTIACSDKEPEPKKTALEKELYINSALNRQ